MSLDTTTTVNVEEFEEKQIPETGKRLENTGPGVESKVEVGDVDRKIYEHVIIENITTQASLLDETQNPLSGDIIQNVNIQIQNESLKTGAKSSMGKSLTIKTNGAQEAQGDEEEDAGPAA